MESNYWWKNWSVLGASPEKYLNGGGFDPPPMPSFDQAGAGSGFRAGSPLEGPRLPLPSWPGGSWRAASAVPAAARALRDLD